MPAALAVVAKRQAIWPDRRSARQSLADLVRRSVKLLCLASVSLRLVRAQRRHGVRYVAAL